MLTVRQDALGRRDRRALVVLGLIFVPMMVLGLITSPRENDRLPALPPLPAGASQTVASQPDGSRVILRRGPQSLWVRIDSAASDNCDRGSIGANYVQGNARWIKPNTAFVLAGAYDTTAEVGYRVATPAAKTVTYRLRGAFSSAGNASGTFTRRDRIFDGDRLVVDCQRRFSWATRGH